jgi:hypothetical protein
MRVWDVEPVCLCQNHLLGEHREIHAIWSILTQGKTGYSKHPETKRWEGKLGALYRRHEENVAEMKRRGFNHNSPLDSALATGGKTQDIFVDSIQKQKKILKNKGCNCHF